ncbi:MAG: tetratricopeptide repeat protein [Terracidiphilus sp.]|jgi:tetratricopeptide (TPR) repeat protein
MKTWRTKRIVLMFGTALAWTMGASVCFCQPAPTAGSQRQIALTLEQQGKTVEAEAAWRACLHAQPANAEPYAHIGLMEARQEHYNEAIISYRKALALNPKFPELRLNLGLALFKDDEMKPALEQFKILLKTTPPASAEAHRLEILAGMAHYGLGQYAEAVPYLKDAALSDPQNLQLRLALAHSCLWSKQYQCVLDVYHEILTLNAESAEADMLAGEAEDELLNPVGAIEQFRAAVKADPKEPDVHFGLGYLLWGHKEYAEAIQEFEAELANNPNQAQALACLADTHIQMNHPELAQPLLEKAIQIDPGIELAHLDLGILYNDAGRRDDALRQLKIAEKLSPNDGNVHWRLGRFYQEAGKKEEAKAEFDQTKGLLKAANVPLVNRLHDETKSSEPAKK